MKANLKRLELAPSWLFCQRLDANGSKISFARFEDEQKQKTISLITFNDSAIET